MDNSNDATNATESELGQFVDENVTSSLGDEVCVVEEVEVPSPRTAPVAAPTPATVKAPVTSSDNAKQRQRKWRSLFPLSSTRDNSGKTALHEDCMRLAEILYKGWLCFS